MKSNNFVVNSLMLPGMYVDSTYTFDDFPHMDLTNDSISECTEEIMRNGYVPELKYTSSVTRVGWFKQYPLRLLYIPIDYSAVRFADSMNASGTHIPAILQLARNNEAASFIIHFHGNACDAAQVGVPARVEARSYNAHYMIVEYPGYGLADGSSSESLLNSIAFSAYKYVVGTLGIPPERIIFFGRSVGCGIAVHLASRLQAMQMPVAAMILHSPYTSIRDVAQDILGGVTSLFSNRWENWQGLCGEPVERRAGLAPAAPPMALPSAPGMSSTWTNVSTPVATTKQAGGKGDTGSSNCSNRVSGRLSKEDLLSLSSRYLAASCQVVQSPVLLLHADNDQIIDHHHSSTLNLMRNRYKLPSELFTQRSTARVVKDHNMFDYEKDVIRPVQRFLMAKGLYVDHDARGSLMSEDFREQPQKATIALDLEVVTAATVPPLQYASRVANLRHERKEELRRAEKIEKNDKIVLGQPSEATATVKCPTPHKHPGGGGTLQTVAPAAPASVTSPRNSAPTSRSASIESASSSTSTDGAQVDKTSAKTKNATSQQKPPKDNNDSGPRSVLSLVCRGWTCGKCCRCCVCCFPCFFTECSIACCGDAWQYLYLCMTDEEPDFEYSTKAHRRMSGGIANEDAVAARLSIEKLQTTQPSQTVAQNMEDREPRVAAGTAEVRTKADIDTADDDANGQKSNEIDGVLKLFARPFTEDTRKRGLAASSSTVRHLESIPIEETGNPMLEEYEQKEDVATEGETLYLPG